jgi:DNA-binding MarR family transcriptional regulator
MRRTSPRAVKASASNRRATTRGSAARAAVADPPPGPPALPGALEFMQTLWALVHALERTSKRMANDVGVTGPQRLVLRVLGLAPRSSAGTLASTLHVHPSTLTGVLERLVAQRLVARATDPQDRRRAVLTLTSRGERINATRKGTVEAAVIRALDGVNGRDHAAAMRVLRRLASCLHETSL